MSAIETQNLIYALNQVIHNIGAAMVIGLAGYGLVWQKSQRETAQLHSALLILSIVWAVQGASGAMFGATTVYFNGELPDIHGVAVTALIIKIICVIAGFVLSVLVLWYYKRKAQPIPRFTWLVSLLLGITALCSAAFLRWFS